MFFLCSTMPLFTTCLEPRVGDQWVMPLSSLPCCGILKSSQAASALGSKDQLDFNITGSSNLFSLFGQGQFSQFHPLLCKPTPSTATCP